MNNDFLEYTDYLSHRGIKGQKWGVRRYQNEDGSYTAKGRKRYALDLDSRDTDLRNVAKIRRGEAQRRLDAAKAAPKKDRQQIKELKERVKESKEAEKVAKQYTKGQHLYATGNTINGNHRKKVAAQVATAAAILAITKANQTAIKNARFDVKRKNINAVLSIAGMMAVSTAYGGYEQKLNNDNKKLRSYYAGQGKGSKISVKKIGSNEFASRKKEDTARRKEADRAERYANRQTAAMIRRGQISNQSLDIENQANAEAERLLRAGRIR